MIERNAFDKVVLSKFHVVELCEIEYMRFYDNGGRNVQRHANFRNVFEKIGIDELLCPFVYHLFFNFSVNHDFCPNLHNTTIIYIIFLEGYADGSSLNNETLRFVISRT